MFVLTALTLAGPIVDNPTVDLVQESPSCEMVEEHPADGYNCWYEYIWVCGPYGCQWEYRWVCM